MSTITLASDTSLLGRNEVRGVTQPTPQRIPADRAEKTDRALERTNLFIIATLFDVACVLWVFPLANQLAELAGVSVLNSIYVGIAVAVASIPVVIAATVLGCRAMIRDIPSRSGECH